MVGFLNLDIDYYLAIGLPARSPACQSHVRRAGASAKAGTWDLALVILFITLPQGLRHLRHCES
jgi:hypothetical protein